MFDTIARWYKTGSFRSKTEGNLSEYDDFWYNIAGGPTSSGASVSKQSAMRQWAVYACITEISNTLAQLPLKLKRPKANGGTEDAIDEPLYHLCKSQPNPQMTSFNWREAQQGNTLACGNSFNWIERSRMGVKGIWPIDPVSVVVRYATGSEVTAYRLPANEKIIYEVHTSTGKKTYPARDILHIVGFGFNGLLAESPITNYAREAIGNAIALDEFQGAAMRNGTHISGVLEHPDTLGDNKTDFITALKNRYSGSGNTGQPMVLENGMKFNKVDISFVDKQFVQQMQLTSNIICGIFKVPPHRIGIFEKNTNYNNTEQGNKAFLDSTMQQWVVRWEQAMNWKLLSNGQRKSGYFFKFNFDALLRPDAKTRSEIQWREWQTGVPLNEIRKTNDQNPIDGGDVSYVPVNMIPAPLAGAKIEQEIEKDNGLKDELIDDDLSSIKNLEKNAIKREIKKQLSGKSTRSMADFLDDFYLKLFDKIDKRTRLILRNFNDDQTTESIISDIKSEFENNKSLILAARDSNYENIEEIWDEN